MLKIKDNVELKILENYGFELVSTQLSYEKVIVKNDRGDFISIVIFCKNFYEGKERQISLYLNDDEGNLTNDELYPLDTIFDLIQAGLVEKVGD